MHKFTIIGGSWAEKYVSNISQLPDCEVVNICRRNPHSFPSHYQYYKKYTDYRDAINDEITDVVIASSPESHNMIARYALYMGKNVILEKGAVLERARLEEMRESAERQNLNFFVNYTHLWNKSFIDFLDKFNSIKNNTYNINTYVDNIASKRNVSLVDDYFPHDLSMIFTALPDARILEPRAFYGQKDKNNGVVTIKATIHSNFRNIDLCSIICNESNHKERTFTANGTDWAQWSDDFKGESLKNMITDFINSKGKNNIDLAIRVNDVMRSIE